MSGVLTRALTRLRGHKLRRPALAALLIAATIPIATANKKPDLLTLKPQPIDIKVRTIRSFQRINPVRSTFGPLTFLGGLELQSSSGFFGGLSGLAITPDGRSILAVTDAGAWLSAQLTYRENRLVGLDNARIGPLRARRNRPLARAKDRDAESIIIASGGVVRGRALISFERNHRIGEFPIRKRGIGAPTRYVKLPAGYRKGMTRNKGFEAFGILNGGPDRGKIIAIAERAWKDGKPIKGWIFPSRGGKARAIKIRKIDGFDVTDLVTLRDGSVILLERKFRFLEGVKMRLRKISAAELLAPGQIDGDILLEANQAYQIDNMEGLAAHRDGSGRLILTMISDDNFNSFQRTILLQFALDDAGQRAAR